MTNPHDSHGTQDERKAALDALMRIQTTLSGMPTSVYVHFVDDLQTIRAALTREEGKS